MDLSEMLAVRFHFNGQFVNDGKNVQYIGGSEGMSHIERDKMSLPEVRGHLADHLKDLGMVMMHWLYPGKQLSNGLRVLSDDKACQTMCDSVPDGAIADIFVELKAVDVCLDGSSVQEIEVDNRDPVDIAMVSGPIVTSASGAKDNVMEIIESSDEDDGDYLPGDEYCSDADEEAAENKTKYKEFKKRYLEGEYLVFGDGDKQGMTKNNLELLQVDYLSEDSDTSYFSASEEEDSYDERSDGELDRRKPKFPRFDKTAPITCQKIATLHIRSRLIIIPVPKQATSSLN
ncbi:hypothetical protein ACP70R_026173 [Stipagrostis hirtigluma subsp. patula]